MKRLHLLRHAGLFGISRRQTRSDLLGLGDSDPQHPRLESALLFDDRRSARQVITQLPGNARESASGTNTAWSTAWRRDPRCENCMIHCGYEPTASLGLQAQARRHLEDGEVQFRREAEADRPRQRDRSLTTASVPATVISPARQAEAGRASIVSRSRWRQSVQRTSSRLPT